MAPPGQFTPPPKGDIAQLAGLARFLAPHARRIAGALCALLVASACVLALGQGLRVVIDTGFGSGDQGHLNLALAGFLLVAAVLAVATWFRFYLMMSTGERVVADLRRAVYNHVLSLSPAYFDSARTGEIVSRLTNDTTQLQQVIGFGISMFLRNLLMTAGAVVLLFVASAKLAALIVLGIPATLVPILLIGRQGRRPSRGTGAGAGVDPRDPDGAGLCPRAGRSRGVRPRHRCCARCRRAARAGEGLAHLTGHADRLFRSRAD